MSLKIIEKKEQPMLSRIDVKAKLEFQGATPSTADVKKQLASELDVDEKLIVIKHIYTKFGSPTADVLACSYLNEEDMNKIEPKPKKKEGDAAAAPAAKK